ncbi:hypothetical protein [Numidum massiliense]|uniref:hypothetical protein n=1 Tax=Numidum massiliense TaxID=1522315 RepID=UPI001C9CBBFB|nr:hypothetical protein [Numidum massiliense]
MNAAVSTGDVLIVQLANGLSWAKAVDRETFQRIQRLALESLIVGAIASIKVPF